MIALAVGLGGLLAWLGLESWLLPRLAPAWTLGWIYRGLYRQGARLEEPLLGEPLELHRHAGEADHLGAPDPRLDLLTGLYLRVLFSPEPLNRREVASAVRAWRGLRWKLFWVKKGKS